MKATVITKLNRRRVPSTSGAPLPNPLLPNDILEITEEVTGETIATNNKWLKTDKGFYVWSGGVKLPTLFPYKLGRVVNYNTSFQNVPPAWRQTGGKDITVGIIDSGIYLNHANLTTSIIQPPMDFTNSDFGTQDKVGHGTHCAGLIVGNPVNNDGIMGVAPQAKLRIYKGSHETFDVIAPFLAASIEQAVIDKVTIISMSLYVLNITNPALLSALDKAFRAGIILVAAAGDNEKVLQSDDPFDYPAYFNDKVISIGSVTSALLNSNQGPVNSKLNFVVPLIDFTSCSIPERSGFEKMQGSSMGNALTAGLIALCLSANKSITTKDQVISELKKIANPLTSFTNGTETNFCIYKV